MYGVKCITFALWINILSVTTGEKKCILELSPKEPVIHVGQDLELTCRVTDCPDCPNNNNVTFTWRTTQDKFHGGEIKNEQTVSRMLIRNISVKHSERVVCKATCQQTQEKTSKIQMFSFPEDPILPKIKSLIAKQEQMLICTVLNIYPLEKFQIEWLRGDKSIHKEEPDVKTFHDQVQNYSSVFNYTPSVDDLEKNISCKATLNLNSQTRTTTAEYGPGHITVSSNNTSVNLGERLEITCHADGNPKPTILWRKLGETQPEVQSQNHKLIINNASWSQAGFYQCNASNGVGSQQMKIKVMVVGPPNIPKIQLSHTEEPKEGESVSIVCSSEGRSAELTLYRRSQIIVTGDLNESAVRLNISSIQITDAGIYTCEAKNSFGIKRSTINITVQAHDIWSKPDLPVAILPAVGSVSLLTAAVLLIRRCRKKAKSDSSNISLD
ncbi:vascular cell adhesion protein 1 isoform X2 [Onychostoma macrolepis]|uniref:vascular cell adhesion protein 1 isoform X2 n=1 Tax=Onychostoma macrolepis TaxID=369639 RepID=UPI00272D19D4|nr:vascular cell adhesion protein 1 isoform X2 [Onychostoma macrolepis]